jgi:AraC-like DNA-binding protein
MECIRMIGYDAVHPSDFVYDVPEDHGHYLLILTHTPLRIRGGDGERIYPAHHAALFSPDAHIHYGACEATYSNDWMIFNADEPYVTQFPLQNRPFPVPDADYCHNLFQLLTWEHTQNSHEAVTAQLMALLFQKLRAGIELPGDADFHLELTALRRRILSQPERDWNVSEMAAQLHISIGYLHLLYKRQFGVSCIDDVIESRVRQAKDYLSHTQLRIQEIAALCGYNSVEHFSRQFRRQCGMSPGQYRRAASSTGP